MPNKDGHRRFGNVRKLPSGRYQIRYPGPDGRTRTGPETYERKSDADKALVIVEADLASGNWTDPERGKIKIGDYAATWITQRPGSGRERSTFIGGYSRSTLRRTSVACQPASCRLASCGNGGRRCSTTASRCQWPPRHTDCSAR
jgi:hypothetical protein